MEFIINLTGADCLPICNALSRRQSRFFPLFPAVSPLRTTTPRFNFRLSLYPFLHRRDIGCHRRALIRPACWKFRYLLISDRRGSATAPRRRRDYSAGKALPIGCLPSARFISPVPKQLKLQTINTRSARANRVLNRAWIRCIIPHDCSHSRAMRET